MRSQFILVLAAIFMFLSSPSTSNASSSQRLARELTHSCIKRLTNSRSCFRPALRDLNQPQNLLSSSNIKRFYNTSFKFQFRTLGLLLLGLPLYSFHQLAENAADDSTASEEDFFRARKIQLVLSHNINLKIFEKGRITHLDEENGVVQYIFNQPLGTVLGELMAEDGHVELTIDLLKQIQQLIAEGQEKNDFFILQQDVKKTFVHSYINRALAIGI